MRRPGSSLVEVLAVLTLTSLLLALVVGVCIAQLRLARVTAVRAAGRDAARTAAVVLSGEARRMTREDVRAMSSDSIGIRAFRGVGIRCGALTGSAPSGVIVRYTGDRLPDAGKDSVLAVSSSGTAVHGLLESSLAVSSCAPLSGEVVMEWHIAGSITVGAVLLVFESGSYHLSDRAFRYRIGNAGRQPLTAEVLSHPHSRFTGIDDHAIRFNLSTDGRTPVRTAYFAPPAAQP